MFGRIMIKRWLSLSLLVRVLLTCLALTACKADDPQVRGQLMVILQTDMSLPKDVTQVKILVKVGGKPYHDKNYIIAPGEDWVTKLPATLAVVASVEDPTPRVEVTVVGLRSREARVFAQAVTTIPESRTATLFVPIQWLCEGQVETLPQSAGYASSCEPKDGKAQACRAGTCVDVTVDEEDLKDYDPSDVFGGSDDPDLGLCFETVKCFDSGFRVVPDEDCIVELGVPQGYGLNLALFNPKDGDGIAGICNREGDECYIPLDKSTEFGWNYVKGTKATSMPVRVQLPQAVCTKLDAGDIAQVRATLACATKTLQFPTCGPWSSVDDSIELEDPPPIDSSDFPTDGVVPDVDGGSIETDSGLPAPAELIIDFVSPDDVIEIGIPVQLQLTAVDVDGNESDVTDQGNWSSADETVASVTRGQITGHAAGMTQVRAELRGKVATFDVVVERGSPQTIEIEGPTDVPLGRSVQLTARATYPDDNSENATEVGVWTSSDPTVATVDESGLLKALAQGTTNISIELNGTTSESFEVTVGPKVLDSIKVSKAQVATNEYQLSATAVYSDLSTADVTDQATWEQTEGQEFGTVDGTGHLTVLAVGEVTVVVSYGGKQTKVNISVSNDGATTPDAG